MQKVSVAVLCDQSLQSPVHRSGYRDDRRPRVVVYTAVAGKIYDAEIEAHLGTSHISNSTDPATAPDDE